MTDELEWGDVTPSQLARALAENAVQDDKPDRRAYKLNAAMAFALVAIAEALEKR